MHGVKVGTTLTRDLLTGIPIFLQESWWRELQVLPSRTHPTMSTSGTGGYLLSGTKVVAPEAADATTAANGKRQRQN